MLVCILSLGALSNSVSAAPDTITGLVEGNRSTNLSYTASQDCTLIVQLDMNGDNPSVTVTEQVEEETPPETQKTENIKKQPSDDSSSPLWMILLGVGIAVVITNIVVIVLLVKRKKSS